MSITTYAEAFSTCVQLFQIQAMLTEQATETETQVPTK